MKLAIAKGTHPRLGQGDASHGAPAYERTRAKGLATEAKP